VVHVIGVIERDSVRAGVLWENLRQGAPADEGEGPHIAGVG